MNQPTMVLLPGNMCDARLWSGFSGMSDVPAVHADLTRDGSITGMAARTLAANRGDMVLAGFSMGGIVALEMARQAPERIRGLILADTNAGADLPERAAARPAQQERVRNGELATIIADELKPVYLAAQNRNNHAMKELLFDMAMGLGDEVFIRQSEALRTRADLGPVLNSFAGPVLLLCGGEDALCPPAWHQAMAARCKDGEVHVVAGAGHLLPLEQPQQFRTIVSDWLTRHFGD
ncbi:MAG: alpha/beta hydrolase [Parasphingorhabdus sp.]|nr:alpha/beta hydrolase [Parasphingorhabdus sp.]